ncbi:MAG: alpha/beta hydrolase [Cyanobacteria bacterium]|nr:alpha/beta hydrolase [Cyanobacteriota bacterium]
MPKPSSEFKKTPLPWMYSKWGGMLAIALMKLNPLHRKLSELEIQNICDFFKSDLLPFSQRKQLSSLSAFWMTYCQAIKRIAGLSKKARQDYYALQRIGCFVSSSAPEPVLPKNVSDTDSPDIAATEKSAMLIIPGLNTPPAFFREMHEYFTQKGHLVCVMALPSNGFADIATSAKAVSDELTRMQDLYGVKKVSLVGHCLGGLIGHYWLEMMQNHKQSRIAVDQLISLGTGFLGADGVENLKNFWIPRNPGKPIPVVFDQLIQANMNRVKHSTDVVRHNILTVWDFMVHFRKGFIEAEAESQAQITQHLIQDPAIDHLTLVLSPQVFQHVEKLLMSPSNKDTNQDASQTLLEAGLPSNGIILQPAC